MSYSDLYIHRDKKIPTILIAVVIGMVLFVLGAFFNLKPQPSKAAKNILRYSTPVNMSHNQVGIYWQTTVPETGWIVYGETDQNTTVIAYDIRDIGTKKNTFTHHFATLRNLKQDTTYYYKIISDNKLITNNDKSFSFKTYKDGLDTPDTKLAYGKIVKSNGSPLENGLVLISINDAYPYMAVTKITGEWLIPLQKVINKNTNQVMKITDTDRVVITVYSEEKESSEITATPNSISPLPQTIILGQNYNFSANGKVLSAATKVDNAIGNHTEILFPKEGATLATGKPLIKGLAVSSSDVDISISPLNSSLNYSFRVKADKDGNWKVDIDRSLPIGGYTITAVSRNQDGKEERKVHNFSITKVGQQVLGESTTATPSATLTPVPTDSTPTTEPTLTPIDSTPTLAVSLTPTPPVTGISVLPVAVFSTALVVIGAGILLAF